MNNLKITGWTGGTREVRFVGYNRDHTAFFVRDGNNTRRAISVRLPKLFDLHFYQNPIGKDGSPPIEINRAALHLPACFATKKEKEAFDDPRSTEVQCARTFMHDIWKEVTTQKCWLEPENDGELAKLLQEELDRQRRLYTSREKETADQIAALPPGETNRAEELRNMLRGEFSTYDRGEHGSLKLISIFDATLEMVRNGWGGLWRNGIYPYVHYHSMIHEALGIARGRAKVRFGGEGGQVLNIAAGDVTVLPAGTGHQCLWASPELVVIGAYPNSGKYDLCRGSKAEHAKAIGRIANVPLPDSDPPTSF